MSLPPIRRWLLPCWRISVQPQMLTALNSVTAAEGCTATHGIPVAFAAAGAAAARQLPHYDRATLLREMQLLPDWYCRRHLQFEPDATRNAGIAGDIRTLAADCAGGPRCSCIVITIREPHDHQQALAGGHRLPGRIARASGYDLASILKDCYVPGRARGLNHGRGLS